MMVPDFTLTTSARLDHDSYFGYHVTPKLYGNWTIDETWALKGASPPVIKNRIYGRTTPVLPASMVLIPILRLVSATTI